MQVWQHGCIFLFMMVALMAEPVVAKRVYIWTDSQGVSHFSDSLPSEQNSQSIDELKTNEKGELQQLSQQEKLLAASGEVQPLAEDGKQKEICAYYRSLLARYQKKGVTIFNVLSGKAEPLRGVRAEQAQRDAKEAVRLFCKK